MSQRRPCPRCKARHKARFNHLWLGLVRHFWYVIITSPEFATPSQRSHFVSLIAHLAGVDPTDKKAQKAGLPPIDSINQWPLLSGNVSLMDSPRTEVPLGSCTAADRGRDVFCATQGHQQTTVNGIVTYLGTNVTGTDTPHIWKLLLGEHISVDSWSGPKAPNGTKSSRRAAATSECGGSGCLVSTRIFLSNE